MNDLTPTQASDIAAQLLQVQDLLEKGEPARARDICVRAVALAPENVRAIFALGVALHANRQAGDAAAVFLKASRMDPAWLAPRLMLAKCFEAQGKTKDALSVLRQTAEAFPDASELWLLRGSVERKSGDDVAAETSFRRYCALKPNDPDGLNNLAVTVRAQGRVTEAVAIYRQALAAAPTSSLLHANLGNALDVLGDTTGARAHLRAALANEPDSIDARYNLGAHLIREEDTAEGVALLKPLVGSCPERWDIWTNLGVGLLALGQFEAAEAAYRAALRLKPGAPETHYDLAWLLLLSGRWREGWAEYEWRWQLPNFSSRRPETQAPLWTGEQRAGETILLVAEQGLGDAIQCVRFARLIRERCAKVVLSCPAPLISLLTGTAGLDELVPFGDKLPAHHAYCPLLSLPRIFDITPETVPDEAGYLKPRGAIPPHLQLPPAKRKRIGFVWAGSADNKIDKRRSCAVEHFVELMKTVEADFVSLQIGPRAAEVEGQDAPRLILNTNGLTHDLNETAHVIRQLDLVIGVDTAVMHLAGALGRPGWILLPFSPDYRWLLAREDTPWYGSIRLFRQGVNGDWPGVFSRVNSALTNWLRRSD
ncbi:MAG: tetratricopeptide repeat protein [Rhodospirillaceae bacterium]|nr:tetratricopeptide repeat protein [Rhodospirillaceae bacterium]